MEMVLSSGFCELEEEEVLSMEGGSILPFILPINPIADPISRTARYIVNVINYNIEVSNISGYNDTVTSNGRADLVKSYPEKPTW